MQTMPLRDAVSLFSRSTLVAVARKNEATCKRWHIILALIRIETYREGVNMQGSSLRFARRLL